MKPEDVRVGMVVRMSDTENIWSRVRGKLAVVTGYVDNPYRPRGYFNLFALSVLDGATMRLLTKREFEDLLRISSDKNEIHSTAINFEPYDPELDDRRVLTELVAQKYKYERDQ